MSHLDKFLGQALLEFPGFVMKPKSSSNFMKIINFMLKVITFGQAKTFMTKYITTIGTTVYTHATWESTPDSRKIIILRHELVHMGQAKKYGTFLFSFLYLFSLPCILTYRAKFEREAYEETFRATADVYGKKSLSGIDKKHYVRIFTGPDYFFMWPFKKSVEEWLNETLDKYK